MMREKKMRRIAGFLLMAVMVFVLSVTAWADGEGVDVPKDQEEFTITLTGAREGHRYETYQIFKGDLLETVKDGAAEKKLSNIEWGSGVDLGKAVDGKTLAQALRENFGELADREDVSAADVAQVQAGQTEKTETAEKFADIAADYLGVRAGESRQEEDGEKNIIYTIPAQGKLAPGYYLVKETTEALEGHDSYSRYIMQVAGDIKAKVKSEIPSIEKKIADGQDFADSNNAGVGKTVSYRVLGKVPDYTGYDRYFYVLEDTMSEGLTFNDDIKVVVGGDETNPLVRGEDYYVYTEKTEQGGTRFRVAFADIKHYTVGKEIAVTYSAIVNSKAAIGDQGNPNKVVLIYSNNPGSDEKGERPGEPGIPDSKVPVGETPEDITITYAAEICITKREELPDGSNPVLPGAEFTLTGTSWQTVLRESEYYEEADSGDYWLLKDGTYTQEAPQEEIRDEAGNVTVEGNEYLYVSTVRRYMRETARTQEKKETKVTMTAVSDEEGKIVFGGLGEGSYVIEETKVPGGYNKAENVTVVIRCQTPSLVIDENHTAKWSLGEGTTLAVTLNGISEDSGSPGGSPGGQYTVTILNRPGSVLPETGGMGTAVFYILGSVLLLGAGVLLAARHKARREL